MQKKLQNSSINCQKTTTSRYEEPEAGILEVCGKVATTAEIDSVAKQLIHHFQGYI